MHSLSLYLLPLLAAGIGWFANWLALKLLFHPKAPKRMAGITFQGIFPKRQRQFALKLGQTANELLNFDDISRQLNDPAKLALLKPSIEEHINTFLNVKLKEKLPVVSMFVGQGTLEKIKEGLLEEIDVMLPEVITKFTANLSADINIERIVTEKVAAFSSDQLEHILANVMHRELFFIKLFGAVTGFLIGCILVLLQLFV